MVEESAHKARAILVKALKFGVDVGRLRMGKPGRIFTFLRSVVIIPSILREEECLTEVLLG